MSPDHARQRIHPIFWAICVRAYAICVNLLRRRHDSRPDCRLPFLNSRPVSQLESELIRSIQGQRTPHIRSTNLNIQSCIKSEEVMAGENEGIRQQASPPRVFPRNFGAKVVD
jgi:hypothetical protein